MVPEPEFLLPPGRVLIVDDDVLVRALIADAARDAGFSVIEAAHGNEALSYLDSGSPVDLIFSDIEMPGLNGIALAQVVAERFPLLPIILTSGTGIPAMLGLAGFIPKPYKIAAVISFLSKTLDAKQSNGTL